MQYPNTFIERVKTHFRLSEVIGKRIAVHRHGKEFQALCPFHNEKTPSFTINDEKNFYYCFGCGAKGDAITFIMEHEKLSYPQALESLANQAGIPIPKADAKTKKIEDAKEKLLAACRDAAQYFANQLNGSIGHTARKYLEQRGIHELAINDFQIGYAPLGREGLKNAMLQAGHSEDTLIKAGLIIKLDGKPSYDRFRGRVMFPIRDVSGKIIAFGGRLLEGESSKQPKYLNSPETPLFNKKHTLFNLDKIRKNRDLTNLLVVEGYLDVISLDIKGIKCSVAPLGTAFSEEHLQLLWRNHPTPTLCFDGDKAGQKAMLRAAEVALPLLSAKCTIRFCRLPNGEDPDSFVRASGAEAMQKLLENSITMSELLWNRFIGNRIFNTPESLAIAESQLMEQVATIKDDGLRKRIITAYKSRIWHISKSQYNKPIENQPQIAKHSIIDSLEQVFALLVHFPTIIYDAEIEHALYNWPWQGTNFASIIPKIIVNIDILAKSREVMHNFIEAEDAKVASYLKKKYLQGIIPQNLYVCDEYEGINQAKYLFTRLQHKIEQQQMLKELHEIAASPNQSEQEQKLIELIKMQQKKILNQFNNQDEPYI